MKCICCGCELKDSDRFCKECGALQKRTKICPGCKTQLPIDARYCICCGTPQPNFCLYCNASLPSDAKFCTTCGTKVNISNENLSKLASLYNLTQNPRPLDKGTDGTAGPSASYLLFGDWPQSLKSNEVMINDKITVLINGWTCYKGSDGCYYVKKRGYLNNICNDYYFKMESIKWRVLDNNYKGGKLLLSEKALLNGCFDTHGNYWDGITINRKINRKTIFPNNYEYSTIRAYLNGLDGKEYDVENFTNKGFFDMAFSREGKLRIKNISVDNANESIVGRGSSIGEYWLDEDKNPYKYVCRDTTDKVFLLSEKEVTDDKYGYEVSKEKGKKTLREKKETDYASLRMKIESVGDTKEKWWWLRSPYYYTSAYARGVGECGNADIHLIVCDQRGLIVPAIVIND